MPQTRSKALQGTDLDPDELYEDDESTSDTRYELASQTDESVDTIEDFRPELGYDEEIMSYPASKHGLMDQCAAIESKTQWIRTKYSMGPLGGLASDFTLSSSLEHLQRELKFGSHGKVGMFIRKDTADLLDRILCDGELDHGEDVETQDGSRNEISSGVSPFDTELTSEMVQDTLEGLDKDLLGVNSQEALNKLTAFVSKTVEENHPAGRNRVVVPPRPVKVYKKPKKIHPPPAALPQPDPTDPFKFAFVSVVATYDSKCRILLEVFQAKVRCVNFDPTFFHSAVLTFPKSECRVAVFETGKFVITGVTTIKTALIAARNTLELLKMCGFQPDISKRNFRAKNLTAMMELGVHLDIAGFAEKYPASTYMDQDTFGAVTHLPEKSADTVHKGGMGMCFLIFATGRVIMVGGKTEKHMITTFRDKTLNMLKPFAYGWS